MSAQLLATELNNLITESKRKHQDLRQVGPYQCKIFFWPLVDVIVQAAEKSLEELKGLRVTNEAQFGTGELSSSSSHRNGSFGKERATSSFPSKDHICAMRLRGFAFIGRLEDVIVCMG